jgi:hypothetical protein
VNTRVNPLADLGDFASRPPEKKPKPDAAVIDELAAETGFHSRQPQSSAPASTSSEHIVPRKQRRYTTGRNVQIPIKGTAETRAEMEALADELQQPYGEILARALAALRREMKSKK